MNSSEQVARKKDVLFFLATEFHYLLMLCIVKQYFPERDYNVTLLLRGGKQGTRGRLSNVVFDKEPMVVDYEVGSSHECSVAHALKKISLLDLAQFISFSNADPLTIYLFYKLRKDGVKCGMAPDGMNAYTRYTSPMFRSRLILTRRNYGFFLKHKLLFPKLKFFSFEYSRNSSQDFLFSFGTPLPTNKDGVRELPIDYTIDERDLKPLADSFRMDGTDFSNTENVILYIGQYYPGSEEFDLSVIEAIKSELPAHKIIFKKHPNQPIEKLSRISQTDGLTVLSSIYPAELLISRLRRSLVISAFSTSNLYNNPSCTFLWIYPLNRSRATFNGKLQFVNPRPSAIRIIESFALLKRELGALSS